MCVGGWELIVWVLGIKNARLRRVDPRNGLEPMRSQMRQREIKNKQREKEANQSSSPYRQEVYLPCEAVYGTRKKEKGRN